MNSSAVARSLPSLAARRWRSPRWRTRAGLALLMVALPVVAWALLRGRPDPWPARAVLSLPPRNMPLMFSPDGRTFLTSGIDGIIPWDTTTGRQGTPWATKEGLFVTRGAYSPDGRTVAVAIYHHPQLASIELIDPITGRTTATLTTRHALVRHLAFADGGRTLRAFLGDGGFLKEAVTWDVANGQPTSSRTLSAPARGGSGAFSPDGRLLAFVPFGSTAVRLWDLEADVALGGLTNPARPGNLLGQGVSFAPDGRTLAVGSSDGAVDLWDVPGRKLLKTLPAHPKGYASMVLRFGPDAQTIASSGSEVATMSALAHAFDELNRKLLGSARRGGSEMIVVDVATGRRVVRFNSSHYPIYSPDGRTLASTGDDLTIRLRHLPGGPGGKEGRP